MENQENNPEDYKDKYIDYLSQRLEQVYDTNDKIGFAISSVVLENVIGNLIKKHLTEDEAKVILETISVTLREVKTELRKRIDKFIRETPLPVKPKIHLV